MKNSFYKSSAWLFVFQILLPLTGCIPVPIYHQVPAETEELDVPGHQFDRIVVAPYFHRAEINEFTEALSDTDQAIEVIDAERVFQVAFPDQDPNIEVAVGELLQPGVRERVRSSGIRLIVVLSPYETTRTEGDATFTGVSMHGSSMVSTKIMAGLVDLDNPGSFEYLEARARGEDSAIWILPYLGLFVFGSVPETEESAIGGMAQGIATQIRNIASGQDDKIMVVAGNWESAMVSYKKEQAMKALQEKAMQGDPDAQWKLYAEDPRDNNLIWLCRAADQGSVNARNALGNLYYHGSEKSRELGPSRIQASLPRSCMWFHLSGQAEITGLPDTEKAPLLQKEYESPEVERTAGTMKEHELAEAEELLLAWEPGQCDRNFKQFLGEDYSKDPALAKLCTAADLGDFTSRDELGRIYFFGSRGVPEDAPRAYMWYRLAEEVYVPRGGTVTNMQPVCDAMTPEQHTAAKRQLEEWVPGQCEKELAPAIRPE